jgi:hypothetical protein
MNKKAQTKKAKRDPYERGDEGSRYRWLVSYICRAEGKKSQVKVGDVREILGVIADLHENPKHKYDLGGLDVNEILEYIGASRARRSAKSPAKAKARGRKV